MNVKIKLPPLGTGIQEATFVTWLKNTGDQVGEGESIAEVMTDKTNIELPAPVAGTLMEATASADDVVHIGDVLGVIRKA